MTIIVLFVVLLAIPAFGQDQSGAVAIAQTIVPTTGFALQDFGECMEGQILLGVPHKEASKNCKDVMKIASKHGRGLASEAAGAAKIRTGWGWGWGGGMGMGMGMPMMGMGMPRMMVITHQPSPVPAPRSGVAPQLHLAHTGQGVAGKVDAVQNSQAGTVVHAVQNTNFEQRRAELGAAVEQRRAEFGTAIERNRRNGNVFLRNVSR